VRETAIEFDKGKGTYHALGFGRLGLDGRVLGLFESKKRSTASGLCRDGDGAMVGKRLT